MPLTGPKLILAIFAPFCAYKVGFMGPKVAKNDETSSKTHIRAQKRIPRTKIMVKDGIPEIWKRSILDFVFVFFQMKWELIQHT